MKTMSHSELMEKVGAMAQDLPAVRALLEHRGPPQKWPEHLRADLFKKLGIVREEPLYILDTVSEQDKIVNKGD